MNELDYFEIRRKVFHIILGLFLSTLIYFDLLHPLLTGAILLVGIYLSLNYRKFKFVHKMLEKFERSHHMEKMPGKSVLYLFTAILLIQLVFDKNIVLASLMILTFGDSITALVGKHFGRTKNPFNKRNIKYIEGTIAGIIIATITASLFVNWINALIASTIALIIESMDIAFREETIDDNFLIPVISAGVLFLMTLI